MGAHAPGWLLALSDRLYRALLVAYPPAFRRAYGAPMTQLFRDCCRDAGQAGGAFALLLVWSATLRDLIVTGLHERMAAASGARDAPTGIIEGSEPMDTRSPWWRLWPVPAALVVGLVTAYCDLHTDDNGIIAGVMFLGLAGIGFAHPRGAWRWVLLAVPWTPLAEWVMGSTAVPVPATHPGDALIGVLIFATAGTLLGAGARRLLAALSDHVPSAAG